MDRIKEGLEILPDHMRGVVDAYVFRGVPMGDFGTAVFSNQLVETLAYADRVNREAIFDWAKFLYVYAPNECWGSPEKVERWINLGGIEGLRKEEKEG